MSKLPENIIKIDQIRINRGLERLCKCEERKFVMDTRNRRVTCASCGSIVDPYDAMYDMALRWEVVNEQLQHLLEQRKQILDYKPWLLTIRDLEKQYRGKKLLPNCPRCSVPFYLEELTHWTGREYATARISKYLEVNKIR